VYLKKFRKAGEEIICVGVTDSPALAKSVESNLRHTKKKFGKKRNTRVFFFFIASEEFVTIITHNMESIAEIQNMQSAISKYFVLSNTRRHL